MSVSIYGLASLSREPGSILAEESSGLVTFTETQVGKTADVVAAFNALTRYISQSPDFIHLYLDSKKVLYDEGGQAKLFLVWAGPDAGSGETPTDPEPVWTLKRSPSEEPIDTHPDFESFAGTPASPLNGAKFDDKGLFVGFETADPNVWGGLSKYLEKSAVVTKTSIVGSVSTSEEIPFIETPSGAPFSIPSISGRNWMKTDLSIVQRGASFEVFEEWTMSGQQGWNSSVYPS